jgi:hypothetical protein
LQSADVRLHGFQTELIERLSERLKRDLSNKIWHEARALLRQKITSLVIPFQRLTVHPEPWQMIPVDPSLAPSVICACST